MLAVILGVIGCAAAQGRAWAGPGMVLSNQKISDTAGNFTPILDNLDEFGGAVAWLGDLDGAGPSVAAMAVGAALDDDGGGDRGCVYIVFLAANGTVLSSSKIDKIDYPALPLDNLDEFGGSVAFLGDLDGAGPSVGAIAVGANFDDDGGTDRGAVYIIYLNSAGAMLSFVKISDIVNFPGSPLNNLDEFGGSIANLGDLDGAGASTLAIAVGATNDLDGGSPRGAVYILFLNSAATVLSSVKISDTFNFPGSPLDAGDDFGTAVANLGDLDGAGPSVRALAVGAGFDDDGGLDRGAVYILFLDTSGTVLSSQKISDTQGNFTDFFSDLDEFGGALAALPDIDGDGGGVKALAVGVAGDDDNGEDRGAVHILFLNADGTCNHSQKISDLYGSFPPPLHNLDAFGSSVAYLGDLDGTGSSVATLAVGLIGDDDGGGGSTTADRGAVYVLFLDGTTVAGVWPASPPVEGALGRAWPNPLGPTTMIPFRLAEEAQVRIDVCDLGGRQVRQLVRARMPAGEHQTVWDGRDDQGRGLPTGTYFYRMSLNGRLVSGAGKVVVLR